MERLEVVHSLPKDGAGYDDMCIKASSVELFVGFSYGPKKDGNKYSIEFSDVLAFRFHDEMHVDVPEKADGSIVEIQDSEWLKKLRAEEPSGISGVINKHHFATFLKDHGYLEVIAERFSTSINRKS
jgi:hypothetical protein